MTFTDSYRNFLLRNKAQFTEFCATSRGATIEVEGQMSPEAKIITGEPTPMIWAMLAIPMLSGLALFWKFNGFASLLIKVVPAIERVVLYLLAIAIACVCGRLLNRIKDPDIRLWANSAAFIVLVGMSIAMTYFLFHNPAQPLFSEIF